MSVPLQIRASLIAQIAEKAILLLHCQRSRHPRLRQQNAVVTSQAFQLCNQRRDFVLRGLARRESLAASPQRRSGGTNPFPAHANVPAERTGPQAIRTLPASQPNEVACRSRSSLQTSSPSHAQERWTVHKPLKVDN